MTLTIAPDPIIFRNTEPGISDTNEIIARNIGQKAARVRFSVPIDSSFSVSSGRTFLVAPGLDARVTIRYSSSSEVVERSFLSVHASDQDVQIPIVAYPSAPAFEFQQSVLDLGAVGLGSSKLQKFSFTNYGAFPGKFRFICTDDTAAVDPANGLIQPNETICGILTLQATVQKIVDFTITVEVEGNHEPIAPLRVIGSVIEQSVAILFQQREVDILNFGHVFYGEKKCLNVTLANHGLCKRSFAIQLKGAAPIGPSTSSWARSTAEDGSAFTVTPSHGEVPAMGSLVLAVWFAPPSMGATYESSMTFTCGASMVVADINQTSTFSLTGIATLVSYVISSVDFNFGAQIVNSKNFQECQIENKSEFLPLPYSFHPIAHFSFTPQSGSIPAKTKRIIKVGFVPRSLGDFELKSSLQFCQGLFRRDISLVGVARAAESDELFVRRPLWETDAGAQAELKWPSSQYGLNEDEYNKRRSLRQTYDNYLKKSARARSRRVKAAEIEQQARLEAEKVLQMSGHRYTQDDFDELVRTRIHRSLTGSDSVTLGFEHCAGMTPPEPPLRRVQEPVKVFNRSARFGKKGGERAGKKFKMNPVTRTEIRDCGKKLISSDLLLIAASHQTIDCGTVSVCSRLANSFQITNNTAQNVLLEITGLGKELAESSPTRQVVPPDQIALFDIILFVTDPMELATSFQYTVNGSTTYSVNVVAKVVPVEIELSRATINFQFGKTTTDNFVIEKVKLNNRNSTIAKYRWEGFEGVFSIASTEGQIGPKQEAWIDIVYKPDQRAYVELLVTLHVLGGVPKMLRLIGDAGCPKLSLNRHLLDFGLVSMETTIKKTLILKNSSTDDGIFKMVPCFTDGFTITPAQGRVPQKGQIEIEVAVTCMKPGNFDVPVRITVCGGLPLEFSVRSGAELPEVQLNCESLDFGTLYLGAVGMKSFSLRNPGSIPVVACLDFSGHHQFHVEYDSVLPNGMNVRIMNDQSEPGQTETGSTGIGGEMVSLVYQIEIPPQGKFDGLLVFQGKQIGKVTFEFPISVENVQDYRKASHPVISVDVISTPLFPSELNVDFGVAPVIDPNNPYNYPITKTLVLRNASNSQLQFRFAITSEIFSVVQMTGAIEFAGTASVFVQFKPMEVKLYTGVLELFAIGRIGEARVAEIELSGIGSCRKFSVSTNYLALPIVPLGVRAEDSVSIVNSGCIPADLRVTMPIAEKQFPITISFPQGNHMTCSTQTLPLNISFMSEKPMSFTTIVGIVDNQGNGTSFYLAATTDNSAFTLYSFLSLEEYEVSAGQGKPIIAVISSNIRIRRDFLSALLSGVDNASTQITQMTTSFLVRYLNSVILSTPIRRFPDDLIQSEGKVIHDLIATLSGRAIRTGYSGVSKPPANTPALQVKLESLKQLLKMLMSQGALLGSVKPEFLLNKTDFGEFVSEKVKREMLGVDHFGASEVYSENTDDFANFVGKRSFNSTVLFRTKSMQARFRQISVESWTVILLQIVKLFVIGRVESESFDAVPGIEEALKYIKTVTDELTFSEINRSSKSLAQSNVFSAGECILLRWATIHCCRVKGGHPQIITDFLQFRNPILFALLFKSHLPDRTINVIEAPISLEDKQANLELVIKLFENIHSPVVPTVEELTSRDRLIFALLLQQLMQILPHFIPSTTIQFIAPLAANCSHAIAITNPSGTELQYTAILEGSSNFKLPAETFLVGPNQTYQFIVEYFARSYRSEQVRISFFPSRQRTDNKSPRKPNRSLGYASVIVVQLSSTVVVKDPYSSFVITGVLYDHTSMTIQVPNVSSVPGTYQIVSRLYPVCDTPEEDMKLRGQQLKEFLGTWMKESRRPPVTSNFDEICRSYVPFIVSPREITFDEPKSVATLTIEFIPISLKTSRFLLLVVNPDLGEVIYEVIGEVKLPPPVSGQIDFKVEAGDRQERHLTVDVRNVQLFQAIGYQGAREENSGLFVSDSRFADLVNQHAHVVQSAYTQSFSKTRFEVVQSTPQFYDIPSEFSIFKQVTFNSLSENRSNFLPIVFHPTKAGIYPCSISLLSDWDIRVFQFSGEASAATKTMSLELVTVSGRDIKQEIPFSNPSNEPWTFKTTLHGDAEFSVEPGFVVPPHFAYQLRLLFSPAEVGTRTATLTVRNVTKEVTVIFSVNAKVDDPPAERRIQIKCHAREPWAQRIPIDNFFQNARVNAISTLAIVDFPKRIHFTDGSPDPPFLLRVESLRSGVAVGTVTLTDPKTKSYLWFVVEIEVERPAPEEVIQVETVARKSATVNLSVHNPKPMQVVFDVSFDSSDFFGDKVFVVQGNSTAAYSLIFSPLKAMTRTSFISFYNETEGEFIYQLNLSVLAPDLNILAPLSASIGSIASVQILIENPIEKPVTYKIENECPKCFQVLSPPILTLAPREQRRVAIRYTPTTIGNTEATLIRFRSRALGDLVYRLSGVGKPPQPLSPVIIECLCDLMQGGCISFKNPFPFQAKFETKLASQKVGIFGLLSRRTVFTLTEYNEPHQIAFSFCPKEHVQYYATVVVSTLGLANEIVWSFPLIGNTLLGTEKVSLLRGRAGSILFHKMILSLVGEREVFKPEDYIITVEFPLGFEWMEHMISIMPLESLEASRLRLTLKFQPKRPAQAILAVIVENPIHQKWRFEFDVSIDRGRVTKTIAIESPINVASAKRIRILEPIRKRYDYRAYFEMGSAPELSVSPQSGVLDMSLSETAEFPFDVIFEPKIYGKLMKGLLIVETEEIEFLYEVHGKIPEYVPPKIEHSGMIDISAPDGAMLARRSARRNFIRENIESVRAKQKQKMKVRKVRPVGSSPFITQQHRSDLRKGMGAGSSDED